MPVTKMTPVLPVDSIEDALPFWCDRLMFRTTAEVPHEDRLGFVILQHRDVELMLQTRASIAADAPALATGGAALLFVEVDDLAAVKAALDDADEVVIEERVTAYGAREIGVRAPGGHVVVFAQFGAARV